MRLTALLALLPAFLSAGCFRTIATNTVGDIVGTGFSAFTEEGDIDLAEKALPSNLKFLEVMLKNAPDNKQILLLLSEGYSSYALGFVEDASPDRARALYRRGAEYAIRVMRQDEALARALDGSVEDLKTELSGRGKDDVPAVFWTGFSLGGEIFLSISDPNALADLPKAEVMMEFVARTDSGFYYGGSDLFLGTLDGSRPRMFGGDQERSRRHFERALNINGGKFLMTYVYYARSLAVQMQDQALFEELLAKVSDAPTDILPEARLANMIAKRKAELLRAKASELF